MSYLKRYVQNHPDNQMAWYLLGKQYMLEDKEAKANYCFLQAGSIYEAYERKRHPLAKEPKQMIAEWNRKRQMKKLFGRAVLIALLVLGIMVLNPFSSDNVEQADLMPMAASESSDNRMEVVFVKPATDRALGRALGAIIEEGAKPPAYGLAVMLEQEGNWRKWTGATRVLFSANRQGSGEAFDVQLHDALTCECQPADATEAYQKFNQWGEAQEQRWTLRSGIMHYHEMFKRWPAKLEDMVRPYPNNVLAGETSYMRSIFKEMLKEVKAAAEAEGSTGGGKAGPKSGKAGTGADTLPEHPLSILVDTANYRLAVVSGDVIVRSYPIGLGGEKTPEGSFYISEKVKNPNGRDDGEFGSRGMTLSGTRYAIHGTNEPDSIGKDESLGCVRMLQEDVEELYDLVPLGTKVTIKNGALPESGSPAAKRFQLQPMQDETNPAVTYRWL